MKKINRTITLLFALLFLLSCGEDRTYQYLELTEECQWIYAQMKEHYLWSDSIKQPEPVGFFSKSAEFYKGLLIKEDKMSYFDDSASETSYGITFAVMRDPLGVQISKNYALVLYADPHSPAHKAGLSRGMWISAVNGKELTAGNQSMLLKGNGATLSVHTIVFDEEKQDYVWSTADTMHLEAAEADIYETALPLDTIYNTDTRKVGYIVLNKFEEETTAPLLASSISQMNEQQATDIIIDLRYNSGGSIIEAARCASMLLTEADAGKLFCSTFTNHTPSQMEDYLIEPYSLHTTGRVHILTSSTTESVAQLFVSALQHAADAEQIRAIGSVAEIIPYITRTFVSPYGFSISPVSAVLYAADGKILSHNSVSITYYISELENIVNIYPLGDTRETLLGEALSIIEN